MKHDKIFDTRLHLAFVPSFFVPRDPQLIVQEVQTINLLTLAQFPVGLDCIFHLRGRPYSR